MAVELDNLSLASYLKPARRKNWSLILGWAIVAIVLFAAIAGRTWRPRTPPKRLSVIRVGDHYVRPPFRPFTVPGFSVGF